MSTTWTNVKARYSATMLKQLTNADVPGASTITDAVGELAVTDAVAIFKREVEKTYDDTNVDHLSAMYELVIFLLQQRANKLGDHAKTRKEMVYEALKKVRETVGGRPRVTPGTTSPLDPNDDTFDGAIPNPTPAFDITRFGQITPNPPAESPGPFPNPFPG